MPRGGHRDGAGRKPGWNHTETQTIRVPVVFAEQLLKIAKKLDNGESIDFVSDSISREKFQETSRAILSDASITRNGKDKGAIKRVLIEIAHRLSVQLLL